MRRRSGRSSSPRSAPIAGPSSWASATRPSCAHVVELLFQAGRGSEALEIYSQIPAIGQLTGDLGRRASQIALANRDFRQAEEIARKAVEANPHDFQARVWLAQVLMEDRRPDDAEAEIRKAVDAAKADPDRWLTLVRFVVLTRPAREGRAGRPRRRGPPGQAAAGPGPVLRVDGERLRGRRPGPGQAVVRPGPPTGSTRPRPTMKDPDDLTVKRRFAEFLLQTNQLAEAEEQLKEILARAADGKSPDSPPGPGAAWPRSTRPPPAADRRGPGPLRRQGGPAGADPDDLRVLALIHEAQGTRRAAGRPSPTSRR